MSDTIAKFAQRCLDAGIAPTAALKAGGVHPTLWKKWNDGRSSPTLRNFEAAERGLESLMSTSPANDAGAYSAAAAGLAFPSRVSIVDALSLSITRQCHAPASIPTGIAGVNSGQPAGELAVAS